MGFSRAQKTIAKAVDKAPMTVRKQRKPTPHFKAYTVNQLLEKYRDPRAVLMEIASMDTAELAEKIGCTKYEALGERRLCAQTVLPYVAAKMPVQVDMRSQRTINLNIVDSTQMQQLEQLASEPQLIEAQVLTTIGTEGEVTDATDMAGAEPDSGNISANAAGQGRHQSGNAPDVEHVERSPDDTQ